MIALIAQYIPASVWAALAGLAAFVGAWVMGRRGARQAAKADAMERAYNAERTRNEIESTVSNTDARDGLRKRWRRPS